VVRAIDRRRVPGMSSAQRNGLRAGFALLVAIAIAGGWMYWRATGSAGGPTPAVAATPLDIAPLPFTATSTEPADAALATGIGLRFADVLASSRGIRSADAARVARALTELGFDTPAALRHRGRAVDALGARA